MKRNIILSLICALALSGFLLAEEEATFTVKVPTANVRAKANASAAIIGKVTAGAVLKVYGKEDAWYEVGITGPGGKEIYGFIHNTLGEIKGVEEEETEATTPAEEKPVEAAKQEVVKARSAPRAEVQAIVKVKVQMANVRSDPDATAEVIARVPAGTLLEVFSEAGNWLEVNVKDSSGKKTNGFIRDNVVDRVGDDEEDEEEEVVAPRRAYRRAPEKKESAGGMSFGLNFGIMTDDSFSFDPIIWTAGVELDFQFGSYLMLSPELTLVGEGFEFDYFILYPGLILNFTASSFFAGGGVVKGFLIGSGASGSTDLMLKLNAGLAAKNIKLTAYALMAFDSLFQNMALGATLGFRF